MGTRDPRIDAYIAKQRDFAKPILEHLREVVHSACPEVEEGLKWSSPHFSYKGQMMCGMAAFKEHAVFGFWKGKLIDGLAPSFAAGGDAAGNLGRLTTVKDVPSRKALTGFIKAAMKLNEEGKTVPRPKAAPKPPAAVPPELSAALAKNRKAKAVFDAFPPSHKREYCQWIGEAKREETRTARVKQAVEWIAEGKQRNWKYQR